ncbi:putative RNA recognition motif domain, nucleotide-binding alpha-beta plait domain superfamily [Helianthus debilis subsp. tardiflorus]
MEAGDTAEEEEWVFPHGKKRGSERGKRKEERPNVLKFFVTNIPSGCRPWDLANAFRSYEEIGGAFIAKKKDKEGRTFGFVSLKGVRNAAELEDSLQKIKLGGNKQKVNVAMFAKENGDGTQKIEAGSQRGKGARPKPGFANREQVPKKFKEVQIGRSFSDILMNRSSPVLEEDIVDIDPAVFTLSDLFGRAYVGRAKDFNSLRLLNVSMHSAGYAVAEIQYIGGGGGLLSVILSFNSQDVAGRFFEDMVIWGSWFDLLDPWIGQCIPVERLAWINIHGVPPHLVAQEVFNIIGQKYEKVTQPSQMEETDRDLTFDRLGIITDCGNRIPGCVNLRWQDKFYRVWVVEETDPWIPNYLEDEDESETISSRKLGKMSESDVKSLENLVTKHLATVLSSLEGEETKSFYGEKSKTMHGDMGGGGVSMYVKECL